MIEAVTREPAGVLVGVDVGGTFTDAVVVAGGVVATGKVPTTPDDQSIGVVAAVRAALRAADLTTEAVTRFAHGMTVGTNALLEGTWARAALVTTEGFGDLLELRRQRRADLYRLDVHHPPPIVPAERVVEARERHGPEGVLVPLTDGEIERVVAAVAALDVDAVAVGLLHAYAHPDHERRLVAALRSALPDLAVSASTEVLPQIREYERISTTAIDAALTPVVGRYLQGLARRAGDAGLPPPAIMQSNGGLIALDAAADHAAWTVLSGPAGGVIGAGLAAGRAGAAQALTFDMGGTSCDVALVRGGAPARASGTVIAGQPLHLPMLDVQTVSAGGGSVAWRDSGGALRVGPMSAGARPGPAAYRRGGDRPTVTDANVVLGRLALDRPLGGEISLDQGAARDAVASLADDLGLGVEECAEGILTVAVQEMVRALRRVSVERGVDPRDGTLVAFGGAGPLHACQVADALGMARALVPTAAGVLSALGLVLAGERRDWVQTVLLPADPGVDLASRLEPLRAAATRALPGAAQRVAADCRYVGQSHAITVPWDPQSGAAALARAFHRAHAAQLGDADPTQAVEVVSLRLAAERPGPVPPAHAGTPGSTVRGPSVLGLDGATVWVAEGWTASPGPDGALSLSREVAG